MVVKNETDENNCRNCQNELNNPDGDLPVNTHISERQFANQNHYGDAQKTEKAHRMRQHITERKTKDRTD